MAILTKAQLEALNQSSFPDNSTEAITPAILRTYNTATIDTLVDSLDTGSFTTDVSALNAFTASQLNINNGLNASTASQQVSINSLNSYTSSTNSDLASIHATTASLQAQLATIGTQSGSWGSGGSVPAGTVSGSAQITAFGFVSGSYETTGRSIVSSSAQITALGFISSSTAIPAGTISGSSQITALGFVSSSVTASSLVTASFSGNTLTFTKGNGTTFGVVIPDVSGSGVPTGTVSSSAQILNYGIFATTGSNTFVGNQTITGSFTTNGGATFGNRTSQYNNLNVVTSLTNYPGNVYNTIGIDVDNASQYNAGFYVSTYTAFGSNPVVGFYGGGNGNNNADIFISSGNLVRFYKNAEISGSLSVSASFDAPLQNGYAYVGNANGRISQVATSSFSSFVSGSVPAGTVSSSAQILNYGIFATTASNNFVGNQKILGGGSLSIQSNVEGSGSAYSNAQLVIDMTTDPTNIYSTYQAVDSSNSGVFGVGINSYNAKDGGAATFNIQGGGNVSGDNTILTVNPTTPGTLKFWKPETTFNSNVAVTGSTNLRTTRITGSLLVSGAFNAIVSAPGTDSQNEWFTYGGFTGNNSVVYPTAFVGLQNYAGSDLDHAFVVTYANSDYNYFSGLKVGENNFGYYLGDGNYDYNYSKFEFVDNGNQTTTATLKADNVNIQGATTITGSATIQGATSITTTNTTALTLNGNTNVALAVESGSIETNGSIFFNKAPFYPGTSNNRAQFAMNGVSEFKQSFRDNNQSGSSVTWTHDTGSAKSSVDLNAKYNGVEGGISVQNLNGSTSVIINVTDSAEIKGNIKFEKGSNKATGVVTTGAGGSTVTNSLVTTNSIILLTTQNNSIAGTLYPATVGTISNGSFTISHNYGSSGLNVAYFIINPAP